MDGGCVEYADDAAYEEELMKRWVGVRDLYSMCMNKRRFAQKL